MAATKRQNINPRIERKITRISGVREVKQPFLIICEGVNTEPDYFTAFRSVSYTPLYVGAKELYGCGTCLLGRKRYHARGTEIVPGTTGYLSPFHSL